MSRKYVVLAACAVVLLISACLVFLFQPETAHSVEGFRACIEKQSERPDVPCIRTLVSELLDKMPPNELMQLLETTMPHECHLVGHVVGQETAKRFPSAEAALSQCSPGLCTQACMHGALGEIFFTSAGFSGEQDALEHLDLALVREEGKRLCTNRVTCHAIGHAVFVLFGDLLQSLAMCDTLSPGGVALCYSGVFMENAGGLFAATMPENMRPQFTRDPFDLLSPCPAMPEHYQRYCFRFLYLSQTIAFRERGITDGKEMFLLRKAACDTVSVPTNRTVCFRSVGWSLQREGLEFTGARDRCRTMESAKDESGCIFGIANAYGSLSTRPLDIMNECSILSDASKDQCYEGLFNSLWDMDGNMLQRACEGSVDSYCHATLQTFIEKNLGVSTL